MVDGEQGILCWQYKGIGPHLAARGRSHIFSRLVSGTFGIFSRYGGDGHSNLVFVHPIQNSCLVTRDTPGISSSLGRAIRTLLDVSQETQGPFPVATVILGF